MTGELHHCSRVLYSEILSVLQFTSFTVRFTNNYVPRTKYNWGNILTSYGLSRATCLVCRLSDHLFTPGPQNKEEELIKSYC